MQIFNFTQDELLFFFALIRKMDFTDLYFDPPKGVPDPLLKALNTSQKSVYKASLSLSPIQIEKMVDLIFDQMDKIDELIGKYDDIQTIKPQEGVPL